MNLPQATVARRPRVGVLSTGDEIVMPGESVGPGQIVSANGPGLCALVRGWGAEDIHLGVVPDEIEALKVALARAEALAGTAAGSGRQVPSPTPEGAMSGRSISVMSMDSGASFMSRIG